MGVMTVLGEIGVEDLGVTQMHEHVLANGDLNGNDYNMVMDDVEVAIEEIRYFKSAGGRTIVDLTCAGLGQDIRGVKRVSEETGVQIVASTGFYQECTYPSYVFQETADQLARRMIRDCSEGIDGTGIRPGILAEIATAYNVGKMSVQEEKVFTAAAYAQVETGLPVSTHCWAGELAFAQIDVLTRNGVPPGKIIIGHLAVDPSAKARVLSVAGKGVFLGIDCIGYSYERVVAMKDPDKARFVRELIDAGFLSRITISQDLIRKLLLKHYHGIGYDYLLRRFVPMLKEAGVTEEEIRTILVENPRRIFS
jgi:phosphotriesterase-related protein